MPLPTLGVGFVAGLSEMTGDDMPNHGKADYIGGWIAHVQKADPDGNGPITMDSGDSIMTADFEMGTIDVVMDDLATLAGTIDVNTFSGSKAPTAVTHELLTAGWQWCVLRNSRGPSVVRSSDLRRKKPAVSLTTAQRTTKPARFVALLVASSKDSNTKSLIF